MCAMDIPPHVAVTVVYSLVRRLTSAADTTDRRSLVICGWLIWRACSGHACKPFYQNLSTSTQPESRAVVSWWCMAAWSRSILVGRRKCSPFGWKFRRWKNYAGRYCSSLILAFYTSRDNLFSRLEYLLTLWTGLIKYTMPFTGFYLYPAYKLSITIICWMYILLFLFMCELQRCSETEIQFGFGF